MLQCWQLCHDVCVVVEVYDWSVLGNVLLSSEEDAKAYHTAVSKHL